MKYLHVHQILISCDDLLHDTDGDAFLEPFVFFDEGVESSVGAILKNEVIMVVFFDDVVAFDDVWMVQLLVDLHFLLEQLQVFLIPTDLFLVHDLYRELASHIVGQPPQVDLACIALPQDVLLVVLVLLNPHFSFSDGLDRCFSRKSRCAFWLKMWHGRGEFLLEVVLFGKIHVLGSTLIKIYYEINKSLVS